MYMINPQGIEHGVIRLEDKAWIPADEQNSDWVIYLAWAEENSPIAWDAEEYGL